MLIGIRLIDFKLEFGRLKTDQGVQIVWADELNIPIQHIASMLFGELPSTWKDGVNAMVDVPTVETIVIILAWIVLTGFKQ